MDADRDPTGEPATDWPQSQVRAVHSERFGPGPALQQHQAKTSFLQNVFFICRVAYAPSDECTQFPAVFSEMLLEGLESLVPVSFVGLCGQ